jgi:molecular chaperone DnaJ
MVVSVKVEPHPVFGRDGDNLTVTVPVTFPEAALGATLEVPTLDGSTVRVKLAAGTPSGRVLRVKGRGIERKGHPKGDLLAKVEVAVPQRLSDEARTAVETFRAATAAEDPRAELLARAADG